MKPVIDPSSTVEEAMRVFYDANQFDGDGGASSSIAWIKFGFFSIPIPNTSERSENLYLHDISHIATGFDTSWYGESSIASWEIASGGWKQLYMPWLLTLWAMGLGVVVYPKAVYQAFQKGRYMYNALTSNLSKEELLSLKVSELQNQLVRTSPHSTSFWTWAFISAFVFLMPFITVLSLVYFIWM